MSNELMLWSEWFNTQNDSIHEYFIYKWNLSTDKF